MPGPRSLLPALVGLAAAGLVTTTLMTASPATAAVPAGTDPGDPDLRPTTSMSVRQAPRAKTTAATDDPLAVSIESLNPSVIPESGRVTITGTVTNTTDSTWIGINIYPLVSTSPPMTSVAELDAAARADDDLLIGERNIDVSDRVDELAPGEVATYVLRIPRSLLGTGEGVHWLGVHALGADDQGRDQFADGKARTFLPLVGADRRPVETALVLQLRRRIQYAVDGRIDRPERWATDLAPTGRLGAMLDLGAAAGDLPLTWLLDPAVIDTVNTLVTGNGSRVPPPEPTTDEEEPEESPSPRQTPSPTTGEAMTDPTDTTDPSDPAVVAAAAAAGQAWLERLQPALAGKQLLVLPYGDVDASAASHLQPRTLAEAHVMSAAVMAALGLTGTPAIGSPNGFLNPLALQAAEDTTTVLATNASVDIDAPPLVDVHGHDVVLSSSTAIEGGPGPDDPMATVAMRQRILSEAAVRLLGTGSEPLVVTLPNDWVPSDPRGFFAGLDVDWLELARISDITSAAAETLPDDEFVYPPFQSDYELDSANFAAADDLGEAGRTLQQVLIRSNSIGETVAREAMTGTSYWQRARPNEARAAALRSTTWIRGTLGRVTVDGPPSVTLSSATGQFPATVTNGLEEPVLVQVRAVASRGLSVEVPDAVELDPGESARLRLGATTTGVGAHSVRLFVASADGTPLGGTTELPIRSNQVSRIIWIVMIAGGGLLFGAIAVRLVRRVRRQPRRVTP